MGQIYWKSTGNEPLDDPTFFGVYLRADGKVHKRDEVFGRAMEKFLIAHRNHHLMFAPEGLDEMLEGEMPEGPYVEADELLSLEIDPLPSPSEELSAWAKKLGKSWPFRGGSDG